MLVTIAEYRRREFPEGSRPTQSTVRRWILDGQFPPGATKRLGKRYFIDLSKLGDSGPVDTLVNKVLRNAS